MGAVGSRHGSSVFVCHIIHKRTTGTINLNLASTGSCEGLLGREKEIVSVIPPHSLKTHQREKRRVAELGATISEVSLIFQLLGSPCVHYVCVCVCVCVCVWGVCVCVCGCVGVCVCVHVSSPGMCSCTLYTHMSVYSNINL